MGTKNNSVSAKQSEKIINHDNNCGFDNPVSSLGIGLVIVPSKFEIYDDSSLTIKHANWDMYKSENKIDLYSKFFETDYGLMHFVCIEKMNKAYKVLVNYSDIKYLPKTEDYNFKTWNEYILQSFGIRRKTIDIGDILENLPLRVKPNDSADTLTIPNGHEMFCPMEVQGDWVKVKYDCFYNEENNPHEGEPCHDFIEKCKNPLTGWLRWRQKNELLIDIFLIP